MSSENNPGLDVLIEWRAISRRARESAARTAIVNCIGCNLAASSEQEGRVYSHQIAKCGSIGPVTVMTELQRLERADVLQSDEQYVRGNGRPLYYKIADSAVGQAFREAVTPPTNCPLSE